MPELAALYDRKGKWDVFVVYSKALYPNLDDGLKVDLLGKRLPDWVSARVLQGITEVDGQRIAMQLRGLTAAGRQAYFQAETRGQSIQHFGTKFPAPGASKGLAEKS